MDALTVVHSLAPRREPVEKAAVMRLTCRWAKDPTTGRPVCIWDRAQRRLAIREAASLSLAVRKLSTGSFGAEASAASIASVA